MQTTEQMPSSSSQDMEQEGTSASFLNRVLVRFYTIDWETVFYIGLFFVAVFTRFVNLGDRVMSHDESLHTKYSYDLYDRGIFQHTPLMHGPILFHMVALSYFLFGDSDFTARLYPAILGIIMVLMPRLLFRRWLGKYGAMVASVLILISPMLLFHHRYIREDTPALFFTLLMVYALFAYLDGVKPRQGRWLVLLAAATLLNLGSKETAFIYILIFAVFVVLLLLFQMAQGWARRALSKTVGWGVVGTLAVPIVGILAVIIVALLNVSTWFPESIVIGPLNLSNDLLSFGATVLLGVPLALVIGGIGLFVFRIVWGNPLQGPVLRGIDQVGMRAKSLFQILLTGFIIGVVAALTLTTVLSIISPESISRSNTAWSTYQAQQATAAPGAETVQPTEPRPEALLLRLALWVGAMLLALGLAVVGTAYVRFRRMPRLPWADIALIVFVAIAVCLVLVYVELRTGNVPNLSSEVRTATAFNNTWIYGSWVIGILAVAGIIVLRTRTTFWQEMREYPTFDVVIVIGSLVLPWIAALPIFLAGYPLDGSYTDVRIVNASILGAIPFVAVAVAAGLAWNPGLWAICAGTFYAIFAFFFTTVFTNPTGILTGVIGSLGYWLVQQGVKRGSQPQYYYTLIEMPIYEFLPLIGAACAGLLGLVGLWRFRAGRIAERQAIEQGSTESEAVSELDSSAEATQVSEVTLAPGVEVVAQDVSAYTPSGKKKHKLSPAPIIPTEGEPANLDFDQLAPVKDGEAIPQAEENIIAYELPEKPKHELAPAPVIPEAEHLERPPFVGFVGYWAVLILMALTISGEKMPWLTTHITLPMCLLSGWYVGTLLEKVDWVTFRTRSWALIGLIPLLVLGLANVVGPFLLQNPPFSGLLQDQQVRTFTWLGAVLLTGLFGYVIYRIWKQVGLTQVMRVGVLGVFVLLGVLTARVAWMAAYINYDDATEFLVYAHGAPSYKTVVDELDEISRRSTDGLNIKMAYDDKVSWPGSWYFRRYPQARFLGDTTGATNLDENLVIVVGDAHAQQVETQLGDKYYKSDLIRLWWPMQEYFNLTMQRIDNALGDAEMRQGLWDIWWKRDYAAYGSAYTRMTGDNNTKFTLDRWPVAERMVVFVRKDVAAQIWNFGTGTAKVSGLPEDPFKNLRCDTCAAERVFNTEQVQLTSPRGIATGPDGNVFVVDSQNARIVVYDAEGKFLRQFGTKSPISDNQAAAAPTGTFREPWGIAVGADGTIYVSDTWNHRIQVFSNDGQFLRTWGTFERVDPGQPGTAFGLYGPRDIVISADNLLYIADTGNKRIRVYDTLGTHMLDFGIQGKDAGQMSEPVGLAINNYTKEIFVANTWNKRIDVFSLQGQFLRSWTLQAWFATTEAADSGNRPYLTLDETGTYLFVTDPDVGRVLVFDTNGAPVLSFGRLGVAPYTLNQFGVLGGIKMDNEGRLFLVDAGSGRILRFARSALPGLVMPQPAVPILKPTDTPTPKTF